MLYVLAEAIGNKWVLLASRCVSGAVGGTQVYATYVISAYPESDRTSMMLVMSSANAMAYAVGPALASVLCWLLDGDGLLSDYAFDNRLLNSSVAPAWLQAALSLGLLLLSMFVFSEPVPPELKEPIDAAKSAQCGEPSEKFPKASLSIVYYIGAAITLATGSWKVHSDIIATDTWQWSNAIIALYLSCVMLALVPVILSAGWIAKRGYVSDRRAALLLSLAAGGSAAAMLWSKSIPYAVMPYTVSSAAMLMALQVERGFATALITKLSPKRCRNVAIGIFGLVICLGRGLGCVLGTLRGQEYAWAMIALASSQFLLISVGYRKLQR
jgi:hypothetical protein